MISPSQPASIDAAGAPEEAPMAKAAAASGSMATPATPAAQADARDKREPGGAPRINHGWSRERDVQGDRGRHDVAAAEAHQQAVAVADAARQGDGDVSGLFGVADARARRARLVPGLTATAATLARPPHGEVDGDVAAAVGAATPDPDRDLDRGARVGADERVAHAFDGHGERGKVDAGLVRETARPGSAG